MKKSLKRLAAFLLTGLLVLHATGCGAAEQSDDKPAGGEKKQEGTYKTLRIGAAGHDGANTMELGNLAYDSGILEEELNKVGYTVEIVSFSTGGPEINEALASGSIDAAIVGDFPAFTSKSNGIDTTIVATANQKNQYGIVVTDGISSAKDLEGKRVIIPAGTVAHYYWEHFVAANGLDDSKIETINAAADAPSLLQAGEADAYAITKYIAAYYEETGLGTVLEDEAEVDGSTTFIFEVKTDLLTETADLGTAINKAMIRAYNEAVENPDKLYQALASENVPEEAWKVSYSFDDTLSFLSPEITDDLMDYYNNLNDWLYDHSIITSKVDVESFIDTSYYAKAKAELD